MKTGLIHIYTGDGKGKTTAAMGLALRAAGSGLMVRIFQFAKGMPSGELNALASIERIQIDRAACDSTKFVWDMTPEEKAEWLDAQQALFDDACEAVCEDKADVVILDEVLGAMQAGAMDEKQLLYLMQHKSKGVELVLTGRNAGKALMQAADYVSDIRAVKHPYDRGTHARQGIEY